ncbi:PepSY domain-containing protein [Luteimonas marina]|uniref:PepSY domain-containing protein n=1 Tax=Luteimonas marina TaxID=488485 RepID=A0A5C5UA47_9GAMM|nr:PepSY domain-containing protein [Luteimonas marina]TWT22465.1 PepSY domain-containing protein [Luteimonas marina]
MHSINKTKTWLAVALLAAGGAAFAQDALTEAEVRAKLEAQGYTKVNDVEFDDGMWEADARSADGNRVQVRIDASTGEVYANEQVANLGKADVEAKLAAAGYSKVHDVELDDGVWKAEAEDAAGKDVELRLDPATGKIIGKARD